MEQCYDRRTGADKLLVRFEAGQEFQPAKIENGLPAYATRKLPTIVLVVDFLLLRHDDLSLSTPLCFELTFVRT